MRKVLVAALPLAFVFDPAHAATTISNGQSTPVATSTAGDVTIAAGGSVTVTGTTPAVTVDSGNALSNAGSISVKDVNNSTGVLMLGGNAGSVANTGAITVNETYTATDSVNGDGIAEAPFASGSGRAGIRLTGTSPFTGNLSNAGTITVQGNGSYGVSLESQLAGSLSQSGTVSLTGDNGSALRELAGVTGAVTITGAVSAKGQNSTAVEMDGDVGGRLGINSALTSTGYASTTRPTAGTPLTNVEKTPTDVEQGGSALVVGGNVGGGVLLGAPPAGTVSGSTADVNADGVVDAVEGTATVTTYGSAPAMVVGSTGRAITLGPVGGTDLENVTQPANAYGLINRGTIQGLGVYDGVSATGLQIGGFTGGSVTLSGGLRNVGVISATSYAADATGLNIGAGAVVPELRNEGTIQGVISASTAANTATAVSIGAGAQVSTITNTGSLLGTAIGDAASSVAVVDRGGSVSRVLNEGVISAVVTPTVSTDATTGTRTALNLSANTSGVTLVQQTNPNVGVVYGNTSGSATTATTTATAIAPTIVGDVLLGSGTNSVSLLAGSETGALDLGGGLGGSLTIDNGAVYSGALRYAGSGLAINVANGTLIDTSATTINASSLNVGAASKLTVAIDPVAGTSTRFVVSGPATFASGSSLGFTTRSLLTGSQSFTLVTSPNLSFGGSTLSLATSPYLLIASLTPVTTAGAGSLTLNVRQRTAAEIGLNPGESAAYNAVYAALPNDAAVQNLLFSATDQASFVKQYDRLLPDYSGGVFAVIDQASRQSAQAALAPDLGARQTGRLWVQEFVLGTQQDAGVAGKFTTGGLALVGGAEAQQGTLGAFGVTGTFLVGQAKSAGDNKVDVYGFHGGVYWRALYGGLRLGAIGSAGYDHMNGERDLSGLDATGTAFTRTAKGDWDSVSYSGRASAAYQVDVGRFFVRPQLHADYVGLDEGGYTETGGGNALNLAVGSRSGHELSGVASAAAGWSFGAGSVRWKPEVEAGVRDVFDGDAGATTAHFASGGNSFTLLPNTIKGAGAVARASLNAESEWYRLGVEASGESLKGREEAAVLVRASASF